MKNRKRDIIYFFICTLPVSALLIFVFVITEKYKGLPLALLPQVFLTLCIVIMILQEKQVLKRESKLLRSDFSKKWDYALEKYEHENSRYRNIRSDSMSKDLKLLYRTKVFPIGLFWGVLSDAFLAVFYYFMKKSQDNEYTDSPSVFEKIFLLIIALFGIICILTAIYEFIGLPVYLFLRKYRTDAEAIERSYTEGKMICGMLSGINVGFEFCVYYDLFSVSCFNVRNIEYAKVEKKIKKKTDRSGFVCNVKQEISLEINLKDIKFPYKISLNEQQLEYLCDELIRRGVKIINNN